MVAGVMLVPLVDAGTKLLSVRYSILQLLWVRFFFPFWFIMVITVWRHGTKCFVIGRPVPLLVRGVLWLGSNICFATAIKFIPLAEGMALLFFSSVILIVLSWLVLSEPIQLDRWVASGLGLVAILMIIRPGFSDFNSSGLLALGAAGLFALYLLSTRLLSRSEPPLVLMSYQLAGALLLLTPALPFIWEEVLAGDIILMFAASMGNIIGHLMIIRAFSHADVSVLAPFLYFEIIMQIVLGYALFGDFPSAWTWGGIVLIVAVGVYVALGRRVGSLFRWTREM